MGQATALLDKLGEAGLLERLNEEERDYGRDNSNLVIGASGNWQHKGNVYIGDDYMPDSDLYNALGAIYPLLYMEQRASGLRGILRKMDSVRYDRVSHNHTPYIRDPQLLSDIGASRPLYWPGLHDEERLWQGKTFNEFKEDVMLENGLFKLDKVNSDFVVAYAVLRSDFTDFGKEYAAAANPEFLRRVLKGIVTLRFIGRDGEETVEGEIEKGRKRLRKLLPKSLHKQIEPLRRERDWVLID